MERILGLYVGCDPDRVWDTWDYLDFTDLDLQLVDTWMDELKRFETELIDGIKN